MHKTANYSVVKTSFPSTPEKSTRKDTEDAKSTDQDATLLDLRPRERRQGMDSDLAGLLAESFLQLVRRGWQYGLASVDQS